MIGAGITLARVITHKELAYHEIIGVSQDSNKKWVLLLATLCAILAIIPLALIYQEKLSDLKIYELIILVKIWCILLLY